MNKTWIAPIAIVAALSAAMPAAFAQDTGSFIVRARAVHLDSADKDSTGLGLTMNNKTIPEVDITYFLTPNLATELILTYPQKQKVYMKGDQIGTFKHLPPTLTLQYHFNPAGTVRPYAGIGLNYTRFSGVKLDAGSVLGGSVPLKVDRSSVGWAAQIGIDIQLAPQWFLNLDAKYVKIDTDISVKGAGIPVTKLDIDPLLLSVGLGYRF